METPLLDTIAPKFKKKPSSSPDDFIRLGSPTKLTLEDAGPKALRLHEIMQKQLCRVPNGFIIPYSFFKELQVVYGKITEQDISFKLKGMGLDAFETQEIIVRSAASCEDSALGSYAGIFDSFRCAPNVAALSRAIFNCWDSTLSDRAKFYFAKSKMGLKGYSIVVQSFIHASLSGVLFTESPSSLEDNYLIEYCKGDAKQLVSGKVTPQVVRSTEDLAALPPLTQRAFDELIRIGKTLQKTYKAPQDIEWAIDRDNNLFILQSRTISVHKNENTFWTRDNMNENYPDVLTPFLASFAKESYFHYYSGLARKFGQGHLVDRLYPYFRNTVGFQNGRIYYSLSSLFKIMNFSPMSKTLQGSFQDFIGSSSGPLAVDSTKMRLFRKFHFVVKIMKEFALISRHAASFEKTVDDFHRASQNLRPEKRYFEILCIRFRKWVPYSVVDFFAMISCGLLEKLVKKIDPSAQQLSKTTLLSSLTHVKSADMDQSLNSLLENIKTIEGGFDNISNYAEFKSSLGYPANKNILNQWNEFLSQWGFRSSGELTLNNTSYLDQPEQLFFLIQHLVQEGASKPLCLKKEDAGYNIPELILKTANKKPFYILNPVLLTLAVFLTRKGIRLRERVRYKQAALYHSLKTTLLELGTLFEQKKILKNQEDIFYLEYQEIDAIIFGSFQFIETIDALVESRINAYLQRAQQNPPNQMRKTFYDNSTLQSSDANSSVSLGSWHGACASEGTAKGRAVVMNSILEIKTLQKGDILVVKQTDPGWAPAFSLISGLVVENGGLLSHGAILAREFRIPTVVGISGISKMIKTGDFLVLNANKGTVVKEQ